ncbi:alpha/beta hydrolase family protein [Anabaena sp. CCY 9910]|uniref:alpha/beta hydrolase family protein n=1 Tax=Anabaena sp. CCY 9910 TaxID=3103870 RepID=UPI0039E1EC33
MNKYFLLLAGSTLLYIPNGEAALAGGFSPSPLFPTVNNYQTIVTTNGDSADIYFPHVANSTISQQKYPIALFLPGSRVETLQYSQYASIVASYGFTVVVPRRIRTLPAFGFTGLLPEASQINDVLNFIVAENSNPNSPLTGTIDTNNLVLLGHSFGGSVGLTAIDNSCIYPVCEGQFQIPQELRAAAFFGTSINVGTGQFIPIENQGIPIALLHGNLDGLIPIELAQESYNLVQEPPKVLITINGVNHYGITNVNNPVGARLDSNNPTLSQDKSIEIVARWSALFLRGYALNDQDALEYINSSGDALDQNVTVTIQTQTVPETNPVLGLLSIVAFTIFPWAKSWKKQQ